jgi:hypothetical protein
LADECVGARGGAVGEGCGRKEGVVLEGCVEGVVFVREEVVFGVAMGGGGDGRVVTARGAVRWGEPQRG